MSHPPVDLMRIVERVSVPVAVLTSAFLAIGCSKASTSVSAPTAVKCDVSVTNVPTSPFPAGGGAGSFSVSTTRDCTWSVAADSPWVSPATTSGQGEATVNFTVAANPAPAPRSASLVVSDERVPLSQAAAPCHFELNRTRDAIGADGGQLSVALTTLTGCTWTAASAAPWITVAAGQSGSASGTVTMNVAANTSAARVGQVNIAGQTYTVTQDAPAASAPTPTPPSPPPPTIPTTVELGGTVQTISGRCPNIAFTIASKTVVSNGDTDFNGLKCTDVKRGTRLTVRGVPQSNGSIVATEIKKG